MHLAADNFLKSLLEHNVAVDAKAVINAAGLLLNVMRIAHVLGAVANHIADTQIDIA